MIPPRIAVHVIHETRLVTTERESVTHGKHDQIRPLFIATTMGRRKKSGKSSTNAPGPSTPEATTPSTDPLVALAAQFPALAHRICDVSDASSKSQSASTCDTVQPSSEVATSAAAPTPFRCSSEREEAGEDRGVDRALPDAQAGNPGASSEVATSAAAPTPFRCSSEREEAGEDRGADSGSLVRGTVRGPAQPPTPSDTQEARPQPSTLEYNAVFPDSDTYAQEVDLSELIPQYLAECESYVEPNISRELYALHPRHLFLPRRSARLAAAATRPAITQRVMDLVPPPTLQRKRKATSPADPILRPPKAKRVAGAGATGPIWFSKDGKLTVPNGDWRRDNPSPVASTSTLPPVVPSPSSGIKPRNRRSKTSRGGKRTRKKKGEINKEYVDHMRQRSMARMDIIRTDSFSLLSNVSHSASGLQGKPPPLMARNAIIRAFKSQPDARGVIPIVKYFFPVFYHKRVNPRDERATFLIDKNGLMFFFRSLRATWLADCVDEFEDAKPRLTAWHVENQERVEKFLALPIIKRIIAWVSNIMLLFFPGLCARMEEEARLHGIQPLFGCFWNLCVNACFEGQRATRIHSAATGVFRWSTMAPLHTLRTTTNDALAGAVLSPSSVTAISQARLAFCTSSISVKLASPYVSTAGERSIIIWHPFTCAFASATATAWFGDERGVAVFTVTTPA
ncbi:hypothetical protein B0H13DRAFT_2569678 [Mycena leptocephala]|nr:hypothetical protein B0H13DRAFT_2569678 [Mycena leptocephala]